MVTKLPGREVLLNLSNVTLCAVTGTMLPETLLALRRSQAVARYGDVLLVTDSPIDLSPDEGVRVAHVNALKSRAAYSTVVQTKLAALTQTPFVMLVQWDGFPMRPENWNDAFYDYDYIGAVWPQFPEPLSVGNGGFSLRSRRLLEACNDTRYVTGHPEDVAICHYNRKLLMDRHGVKFAPGWIAEQFSYERMGEWQRTFGFHGLFNMPQEIGLNAFLTIFEGLDQRQIGVRELADVREVLLDMDDARAAAAARQILADLMRSCWHDLALWRYLRRRALARLRRFPLT